MAASMTDKKLLKKMRKHQQMLVNREKITVTEKPTRILCVSNGGLENGVSYEEVQSLFSVHGECDVIMVPRKSYCIVCFTSVEAAESAFTPLNGHKLEADDSRKAEVTLYLAYIDKAPDSLTPSTERPPGLILLEDFVSQDCADEILQSVDWNDSSDSGASSNSQRDLKHRRVKHYGYEFKYSINNVDPDDPLSEGIPEVFRPILEKLLSSGVIKHYPDQLTVNQYLPGQGIPPHVDTPSAFEDGLVSLSLGSQVIMEFRHPDGRQMSVLLPNRSALVMTGESRYIWSHGITPRKSDIIPTTTGGLTLSNRGVRTSFTFRKITGVRHAEEKSICWNGRRRKPNKRVYEEIADHFSGTRHTPWPRIVDFLKQQPCGSVLVDIGCGNGKYFGINKQLFELGSDRSSNLAQICQQRGFQVFVADILAVPVRSGMCDVCLCIAVIHHLSTQERRLKAVTELLRILRPGGKALIYVWAMEQELNKVKSKYLKGKKQNLDTAEGTSKCTNSDTNKDSSSYCIESPSAFQDEQERVTTQTEKLTIATDQGIKGDTTSVLECKSEGYQSDLCNKCDTFVNEEMSNKVNADTDHGSIAGVEEGIVINEHAIIDDNKAGVNNGNNNSEGLEDVNDKPEIHQSDKANVNGTEEIIVHHKVAASLENTRTRNDQKNTSETALKQPLAVHVNRTEFKQQDVLVPWQLKKKDNPKEANTFHRFYHVFQKGELESLSLMAENCKVLESYYDQGNWAVILEKL